MITTEYDEYSFLEEVAQCHIGIPEDYGWEEDDFVIAKDNIKPAASSSKTSLVTCPQCSRAYKTLTGYANHVKMHRMADAYSGVPDITLLYVESPNLANSTLKEMLPTIPNAGQGPQLKELVANLIGISDCDEWEEFVKSTTEKLCKYLPAAKETPGKGRTYPMPSETRAVYLKGVATLLTTPLRRDLVHQLLEIFSGFKEETCYLFVPAFVRRFADKLLAYIIRSMKVAVCDNNNDLPKKEKSVAELKDFQEIIHFVGGSVIRRVLNRALPLSELHSKWDAIVTVVTQNMSVLDPSITGHDELMSWTKMQDRGGLLYINPKTLQLFLEFGFIAEKIEKPDGAIVHEEFMERVTNPSVYSLWSEINQSFLPEPDSYFLLDLCVLFFSQTWGKGSAKMRMNILFAKATTSVALRPGLASNK